MTIKILVIDPVARSITARDVEMIYPNITDIIGNTLDVAGILPDGDTLWCDDEFLFKPQEAFFTLPGIACPIGGVSVITGTGDEDDIDVITTPGALLESIRWMDRADYDRWALANSRETAVSITTFNADGSFNTQVLETVGSLAADMPRAENPDAETGA